MDRQKVEAVSKLGTGKLDEVSENHFRRFWSRRSIRAFSQAIGEAFDQKVGGNEADLNKWTPDAKAWVKARVLDIMDKGGGSDKDELGKFFSSKRPFLKDPGSFKKRVFEDMQTGLDFGLAPESYNPMDSKVGHWQELDKYIISHAAINALVKDGGAKFVPAGEVGPSNMQPVSNGQVWEKFTATKEEGGEETVRVKGQYWVEKTAGQVIENYLSRGLYEKPFFRAYMGAANWLNMFQLGTFSAFHGGFTTMETLISQGAKGFKSLSEGNLREAAAHFKDVPKEVTENLKRGNQYMEALSGNPAAPGWAKRIIPWVQMAGGSTMLDRRGFASVTDRTIQLWKEGSKGQAIATAPFAAVEQGMRPIMEWLVPRQKIGVFASLMDEWTQKNPGATHEQTVAQTQKAWNLVDERLGQVVYNRLFVNNTAKNIVQAMIRAPGWTGGTILQVGRGMVDIGKYLNDFRSDPKTAVLTDRAAYTLSLITTTAIANGILTALFTGEQPDQHDLLAFRTGEKDEHGNPIRFMLPTYMKDMYAWAHEPGKTALNKTHPMISLLSESIRNQDYYGTEIVHPGDDPLTKLFDKGKHTIKAFEPFWMRGERKVAERSGTTTEKVLPLVGVMPAPTAMTQSPAQRLAGELSRKTTQTSEQFERRQIKKRVESTAGREGPQAVQKAVQEGTIGQKTGQDILKDIKTPPILRATKNLDLQGMTEVWDKANDQEKSLLRPRIVMSWMRYRNTHSEQDAVDMRKRLSDRGLAR